jgi:SAM-dependent methyltransferase
LTDLNQVHEFAKRVVLDYNIKGPILDIGASTKPIKYIFEPREYIGLDFQRCDIIGDANNLPIKSESFPTVITTESLEHFRNPYIVFEEMSRVLMKNGYLFLTTVWSWPIHLHPTDYWRFTKDCISMLMQENGIKPLIAEHTDERPGYGHTLGLGQKV